jgi:glutathione synthase
MKHILLIDPLEKLVVKKDSSILLATTLKNEGYEVYFLIEDDFFIKNKGKLSYRCYDFCATINDVFYIEDFSLKDEKMVEMDDTVVFHMRIDPPYDSRYQRYLWMQEFLKTRGVKVVNDPVGIMKNNEKIKAYERENSLSSFVGSSVHSALHFIEELKSDGIDEFIFKPLDLFQGIGVEKVTSKCDVESILKKKLAEFNGPVVIQPFVKEICVDGEIRTVYFKGEELGTILKIPVKGEYLANIAQGAKYGPHELSQELKDECREIALEMAKDGVDLIAYDILGGKISEINVTCPGLLVEVSSAMKRNLALDIVKKL